jgi:sec-independent protein translocase protein TatB
VGNFTFSEIIWIVVIILIIFGPQRLPEMARRVGGFVAKARDAATALQQQINEEYGDTIQPLKDARNDLRDVKRQITDTARSAAQDVEETTQIRDVTREVQEAGKGLAAGPNAATIDGDAPAAESAPDRSADQGGDAIEGDAVRSDGGGADSGPPAEGDEAAEA